MQDERGTTITANKYLNQVNINKKKRKKIIDTVSATVILQDYLNSTKNLK
jgi:putative Holliday junction resolvase